LLGYGGSSAVFLARQHNPDREVAVKVFLPRSNMDKQMQREFYNRFLHEAEAAKHLDHPHILPIYAYGEQEGLPYIVMPYMEGGTLSEHIAKNGPLALQEAEWYLYQIASALDYAHEHGCVHCDVKPANILLDNDGRTMLSDFGIARVSRPGEDPEQGSTKIPDALMGTPDYISPEQAMGLPLDGRSDIYSLGVTLFYMLAKQLPFKADSTLALALLHVHEPPPSLGLLRADISPAIDRVVRKALAKGPDTRYQTASAFNDAFAEAIELAVQPVTSSVSEKPEYAVSEADTVEVVQQGLSRPSSAIVSVKSIAGRKPTSSRLVGVLALVAVTIGVTIFGTSTIASRIRGDTPTRPISTPVRHSSPVVGVTNALTDQLMNHESWPVSRTFFYSQEQYHIQNKSLQSFAMALYNDHLFGDFRLTVTMTEVHASASDADYYGVVFRSTVDQSRYYLFEVDTDGSGEYAFWRYDGQWKPIDSGLAPQLLKGPAGKSNTITVEAHNNNFTFFINGKSLDKPVTDSSPTPLNAGEVGLYVEDSGAEVVFSHLYINTPG
jgi:serine/threonine protein kinase